MFVNLNTISIQEMFLSTSRAEITVDCYFRINAKYVFCLFSPDKNDFTKVISSAISHVCQIFCN